MIQSLRNKQTLDILRRLKEQGPPGSGNSQIGTVSLDMTLPPTNTPEEEGTDELNGEQQLDETGMPTLSPRLKKKLKPKPSV